MHTLSEENYLKAIYKLSLGDGEKISATAIAEIMGNNAASVVDMIKKLVEKGVILYDKKTGVSFTSLGYKHAVLIVRKHRLWEVFLHQKLAYSWDQIHAIAEELEHVSDPYLADKLDAFLGNPDFDPHGDPIPKADGKIPERSTIHLSDAVIGTAYKVAGVKDTSRSFLQYLEQLTIQIGTPISVLQRIDYDQSVAININTAINATVSKKFADNILVIGYDY